jgi:sugar phosphate isomerase/epimerase
MQRREFLKTIGKAGIYASLPSFIVACGELKTEKKLKISLAEWSLHSQLFSKKISHLDFPKITKQKFGIDAVEHVSQFFQDKATDKDYLKDLKNRCDSEGVYSHLIMVDLEGSMASNDQKERNKSVENHYKWVEAAKFLGCKSLRINLHGECSEQEWVTNSVDSLGRLVEFGAKNELNIIVENHGQWSSKGNLVASVMQQLNHKNCGTLPDFGNFCVRRRDGDLWESPCIETYDCYQGVQEMLPFAKGASAKTFAFDKNGNESTIDFKKMFELMQTAGFEGYVGVEYEGGSVPEDEGVLLTKKLIEKFLY